MSQAAVGSADILAEGNTDKREEAVNLAIQWFDQHLK